MKKFTTSAQKTTTLPKAAILKKLANEIGKDGTVFKKTTSENIRKAVLPDGSTLVIASFDKENGKTLAMIDHKNLPDPRNRNKVQKGLRKTLDNIFEK